MKSLKKRFWSKVAVGEADSCWEWLASKRGGYGRFCLGGKHHCAHRVAWTLTFGEIPEGLYVLHDCDNPTCVNPQHLNLGDHLDNMMDMRMKRRSPIGERNGRARLSESCVRAIRQRALGGESHRAIAKSIGLSRQAVDDVVIGRTWRHIK